MATILIVDDLAANRKFLLTLLRAHGYRLLEAADGCEALAIVRAEHPDLVITDVLMPVMDGYELVRQMRLDPATAKTLVVLYTAYYGEREARVVALSNGVDDVLTKPAQSSEVLKIVGRVLAGELETKPPAAASVPTPAFDREHLRLLTDNLPEPGEDLRTANARLRAMINIGLELASERDADRLFRRVCVAARDLFGATYVTLGIVDLKRHTVQQVLMCGADPTCDAGTASWIETGEAVSGIFRTVLTERRTLRGNNPGGDPTRLQLPVLHPEVQAFLAAPIVSPAEVYGWLCLVGNEGRSFSDDDEPLVMALSAQVGRIYENLVLSAVARKRAEELESEILERKQAEAAVRHARDRAQRYLDTAEVILLALDLDGRIKLINRKGCDLLGWAECDLVGRDFLETCLPLRSRAPLRENLHTVVAGGLSVIEIPVLTRSGEERLIEWRNTPQHDDAGLVVGSFSSGADITDRSEAVEALRAAEERMRFALKAAGIGIWDMDYTTGVLQWSAILEAQYGVKPGTFGRTFEAFLECVHPADRASMLETIRKVSRSDADFSLQNRSLAPDGTVRWLSGQGHIWLDDRGQPLRGVGISMDVTERRTLEAQYLQSQKLEAVGRLAGGVAHDFNNLVTGILGFCELLLADFDPGDPRCADIAEIQKAGASAADLIRQLLSFSRKGVIEPTRFDLNGVVTDMRALLGRLIGEDVTIALGLPNEACVQADRGQVEQIVMNLAVNARDAMPGGGRLTIETTTVDLDERYAMTHVDVKPGRYVALTVTDTGVGMTPEVQAHLFEPFFTTKEVGKGTGLGLASVHAIVTRNGGSVDVSSDVGRGSSFTVYLPKVDAGDVAVVAPPLAARPLARPLAGAETVLVVDDAAGLRVLTKRLLQRLGYNVLIAADGEEALRVFEQNASIGLLLTDVVMPGASGPELTRQLISKRPALKVIYMSGYTEETIAHHGILHSGTAFLHKPFTSESLGRKIREVLDQ